jgi:hypothetical protein
VADSSRRKQAAERYPNPRANPVGSSSSNVQITREDHRPTLTSVPGVLAHTTKPPCLRAA